jgi:uroporphyrinogen decarboxylase
MCGRSRAALPLLAESGIDLLEPLESAPGGDVVLAEVKNRYGGCFCLKGNVNTFHTLARSTPEEVETAARKVIEDAGENGGLILSTGDQTPGDTPEENFVALISSARRFGAY